MRALSIRQPFAELILQGIKTVEYRSQPTRIIGERFHIYASKGKVRMADFGFRTSDLKAENRRRIASDNLAAEPPPAWLIEIAEQLQLVRPEMELPVGVIVGSAVILKCEEVSDQKSEVSNANLISDLRPLTSMYAWHLAGVERARTLRKPKGHPQPVWFRA